MNFIKHNLTFFFISIVSIITSFELETRVFHFPIPLIAIILVFLSFFILLQLLLLDKIKIVITKRFNELAKILGQQETINRNIMFAIEEIIDLQRNNNK